MDQKLTTKQQLFFEQLHAYCVREGVPPTVRDLQALGGFRSPRSVMQYLEALERAGYVRREKGARNIRLLRKPPAEPSDDRADTVAVPVVGHVQAGAPMLADQSVDGYVQVSRDLAPEGYTYFLLRVVGNSMDKAGIDAGDLVLVRQQPTARTGDVVVALVDDGATIKRLRIMRDAMVLEPESTDSEHRPIVLRTDFRIQGRVMATL